MFFVPFLMKGKKPYLSSREKGIFKTGKMAGPMYQRTICRNNEAVIFPHLGGIEFSPFLPGTEKTQR